MRTFVLFCLIAAAVAAPPAGDVQVVRYDNENIGTGDYKYAFEQNDGNKAEAVGEFHAGNGKDNEGFVSVKGSFEYVGPDGVTYTSQYVADENGYRPVLSQGPNGVIPAEVIKVYSRK